MLYRLNHCYNLSVADSSYQSLTVIRSDCKKVNHFAMIKTEKTGSSTLFSILARFVPRITLIVFISCVIIIYFIVCYIIQCVIIFIVRSCLIL